MSRAEQGRKRTGARNIWAGAGNVQGRSLEEAGQEYGRNLKRFAIGRLSLVGPVGQRIA